MKPIQEITGVVLAGGRSSRFGSNKALALYHGKLLVQHARDAVSAVFNDCLLSTNSPRQYEFLNMPMISDRFQNMGPLAGIQAALSHTAKQWIFVMACDMPAVTPGLISFLCGFASQEYEAVIPWLETGPEPLCGLYHKNGLAKIELQLKSRKPKMSELLEQLSVRKVSAKELLRVSDGLEPFANINRKQDLDEL